MQNSEINKVIELCLKKEFQNTIDILKLKIKLCETKKNALILNKPLWFQKKKLVLYNEEIKNIDRKIEKYMEEIEVELDKASSIEN